MRLSTLSKEVIIIGAGAAGLMAARLLKEAKISFRLLEARSRIGGRVWTTSTLPTVELGPEFLHGETPVTDSLIRESGLPDYDLHHDYYLYEGGKLRSVAGYWNQLKAVLGNIKSPKTDLSFDQYLKTQDHHSRDQQKLARTFVQGFDAAEVTKISTQALSEIDEQVTDPKVRRLRRLLFGYSPLLGKLADHFPSEILLSHVVEDIVWEKGRVQVSGLNTETGVPFLLTGKMVLITIPISLLKTISLHPRPTRLEHFLDQNEMGQIVKMGVELSEPLLRSDRRTAFPFVLAPDLHFTTWWGTQPIGWSFLTAWCGGEKAIALAKLSSNKRKEILISDLSKIVKIPKDALRRKILRIHEHDWNGDPYSLGAYSYPSVRYEKPARTPTVFDKTLFLAGEAFHPEMSGTVEGALLTGRAAARKMIRFLSSY